MSYSRWSNSLWYTYWHTSESCYRDEQLFDVCSIQTFTYAELKENIQGCLDIVYAYGKENFKDGCTKKDIKELKGYMKIFMKDVESDKCINEAELVRATPDKDLPLIMSKLKYKEAQELLAQRLGK